MPKAIHDEANGEPLANARLPATAQQRRTTPAAAHRLLEDRHSLLLSRSCANATMLLAAMRIYRGFAVCQKRAAHAEIAVFRVER